MRSVNGARLSPLASKSTPCSRPGTQPWHNYETSEAVIDAELDAMQAADGTEPAAEDRPWWENDPRFTERFK